MKGILIPTYYVFLKIPSLDVEQGPVHLFQVEEKLCCQGHEVSQRQSEQTHVYPLSKPLTIEDDGVEDVGGKPKQEKNRSGSGVDDDFKEELSLFIKKATLNTRGHFMFVRYIMSFTEAYFIFRAHKEAARFDTDSCLTIVASVRQHAKPTYPVGDEVVRVFPWLVTVRWHHQTSRRSIWHRHGKGQSGRRSFLLKECVFVLSCAHVQHRGLMACRTRA